jgi:hypothetical protein
MDIRAAIVAAVVAGSGLSGLASSATPLSCPRDEAEPYTVMDDYVCSLIYRHRNLEGADRPACHTADDPAPMSTPPACRPLVPC